MREVRISASFCTSRINIGVARLRGDTGVRLRGDMVYACEAIWCMPAGRYGYVPAVQRGTTCSGRSALLLGCAS